MRVAVVSSDLLTSTKRAVIAGLHGRLIGIATVPIVPRQVGMWRHLRSLAVYAGPRGWPRLALDSLGGRLARTFGPVIRPGWAWTLGGLARSVGVSFLRTSGTDDPALARWLSELKPDLIVSLQSHRVPQKLLAIPDRGWLNLHHGRLPDYRGVFSVFWAMSHREPLLYVTAHLMSAEIDRGPVVIERAVSVEAGATVADMEARMWTASPEIILEAVCRIESGAPLSEIVREGDRYFTYPTRADLRRATSSGLRLR